MENNKRSVDYITDFGAHGIEEGVEVRFFGDVYLLSLNEAQHLSRLLDGAIFQHVYLSGKGGDSA